MSTYTDLRNRVKENITVGYPDSDRTTLQKVKFHNEENEYWGTFAGSGRFSGSTFDGGALSGAVLYGPFISAATLVNEDGTKVKLSELGEGIEKLSAAVSCALSAAPSFNTILSGESEHMLTALQLSDAVSVLIDIKKLFASLSA